MEEENNINEINNYLNQAKSKFNELEQEFSKFQELKTDLQHKAQGIRNFFTNSNTKSEGIATLLTDVETRKNEIDQIKSNIETKRQEIDSYHQKFVELRTQLDDESDGLEANHEWIKEKREDVDKKYQEVIKFHGNISNLLTESVKLKDDIVKTKNESIKLKEEIAKWLDLISDTSRFSEFNKRKKQLTVESYIWMIVIVMGFVGLAIFIYAIFKDANGDFVTTLNKSLYTTPIVFFLLWATRNYSDVRGYLEKYSFKAIMSVSLSTYLELLESKFGKDCKEYEKFAFERIKQIFVEPYKDKERKQLVNFLGGKIMLENSEKPLREDIGKESLQIEEDNK
jgi:uncharacterized coiled-coil DUF342 family protein